MAASAWAMAAAWAWVSSVAGGGGLARRHRRQGRPGSAKRQKRNGAEGAPEKRGMVLIHGLPPDRRGAGSSGPPAPIVEGRAPFVKNRSFVLPSFFKPVTDWPRPAACTGGQNAVYSDHEKRPAFRRLRAGRFRGPFGAGREGKPLRAPGARPGVRTRKVVLLCSKPFECMRNGPTRSICCCAVQQRHGRADAGLLGSGAGRRLCGGRDHRPDHRHRGLPPGTGPGGSLGGGGAHRPAVVHGGLPQPGQGVALPCGVHLGAGAAHPVHPQPGFGAADHRLQRRRHRQLFLVPAGEASPFSPPSWPRSALS